ncbi:MAG: CHAT domain-containing tetratricopeptide repeat protein [Bacteroidota bacterium]
MNALLFRKPVLLVHLFFAVTLNVQSQEEPELREKIHEYGVKGFRNVEYNLNFDTAEYYLKKALDLQYANYEILDDRVATNHISLASVYRRLYNYNLALFHLEKADSILTAFEPNSILFGNIYNNKGNIIGLYDDVYRTIQYYEYALDFMERNNYSSTNNYSHIFSNYIRLLFELEDYEKAEGKLAEIDILSLELNPYLEFRFSLIFANSFAALGLYENAMSYFKQAEKVLKSTEVHEDNSSQVVYYTYLIDFYIKFEEFKNANEIISQAFLYIESLNAQSVKYKIDYYSNIQYRRAFILYLQNRNQPALELVDRGIEGMNKFFEGLSLNEIGLSVRTSVTSILPDLHILKSRILLQEYFNTSSIDYLKRSYSSYQESIRILDSRKLAMENEESKLYATAAIIEVYKEAIYVGKQLYALTGDLEYLEKSFEFTESSKSFALFSEINNVEAMEFSDLPKDVKEKEQRLSGEIQGYEEMLYKEQLSTDPDSSQIAYIKEKLFQLRDDYRNLKQDIEQNNAKYFELKYNPKFVTLKEIQSKLPYRDALIEYVLNDTMLITYVIDKKGINVFSQAIEPEFSDECFEYYNLMHTQNFSNGVHENYMKFVQLGQKFYKILIEPCLKYTDRKNLTIVPDGAITYLPFEGFITDEADLHYINYLNLPYLIKEFSVGYSHSATMMFSERLKTKSPENKVLAFAPSYYDPLSSRDTSVIRQVLSDSNYLLPLGGIIKEVQSINETVPSRVFLNENATEANFKKYAPDYNVLHLAMHTIMKDDNPLHSLLAFTNVEVADTTEDNKLYAYEIYNLKLNAQMAVLSSCSSGFGKMQKGEGMMSLARGFIYAGCPCIVMTLWQVSDKSSSELMTSFYKYLKKGKSKQEAMRLSKMDYLERADDLTSNPYFWSGFVIVGDSSPIYRKSGMFYWASIIALFIGILIFFQYKKS